MRVVSLLPSATEMLAYLGHAPELVGRSEECDFPQEIRDRPVVMGARTLDGQLPSGEIDARVRAARGRGESLYSLDLELLRELRPELILTQDLCGVCSVTEEEVLEACRSARVAPEILSLSPRGLRDVAGSLRQIARAVHDAGAGERAAARLEERLERRSARSAPAARVAVVEWLDPPILAGLWVPEMIRLAGGEPWNGAREGSTGVRSSWEDLRADPPDHLVLSPCSFSVPRTLGEVETPGLRASLSHFGIGDGWWVADEAYFSRPGPRLWEGLDLLRAIVAGRRPATPMPFEHVVAQPAGAAT
ncbi:MAG: cobalamin-binding protein [Thermoplasmata archaeon]|nr:cobalamin-binding protein [Thermoplasmata archaeon]